MEVEFNQKPIIKIGANEINELKENARKNKSGKYRLCLHHSAQDELHEMLIVRREGDYFKPDKHLYTSESHTIVDGAMMVIIFENSGEIREAFELSARAFRTYRIHIDTFHMQIPLTEQVVYYEVKQGPFNETSNIYPEWAPDTGDEDAIRRFMGKIEIKLNEYLVDHGETPIKVPAYKKEIK